jgi:Zn-finger protein
MVSKEMKEFFPKHQIRILKDLKQQDLIIGITPIDQIIKATSYKERKITHSSSCPCYQTKPCHNLELLNCFLCGCPEYDIKTESGACKVNSRFGNYFDSPTLGEIWDCNGCSHPHYPNTVKKYLQENLEALRAIQERL